MSIFVKFSKNFDFSQIFEVIQDCIRISQDPMSWHEWFRWQRKYTEYGYLHTKLT